MSEIVPSEIWAGYIWAVLRHLRPAKIQLSLGIHTESSLIQKESKGPMLSVQHNKQTVVRMHSHAGTSECWQSVYVWRTVFLQCSPTFKGMSTHYAAHIFSCDRNHVWHLFQIFKILSHMSHAWNWIWCMGHEHYHYIISILQTFYPIIQSDYYDLHTFLNVYNS